MSHSSRRDFDWRERRYAELHDEANGSGGGGVRHQTPHEPDRVRAYEDLDFMRSADARSLRVLAELTEPQFRLRQHGIEDTIVFFGSARIPAPEEVDQRPETAALARYYADARELSRRLTRWNLDGETERRFMVCSGGGPGIMEAVSRGAADADGESVTFGIDIPHEPALNPYVSADLAFVFHYFFTRKFWFAYNAKAIIFFPGGFGTMDEMMEVMTLIQTGRVHKELGILLYGTDFWRSVIDFEALVRHGVISQADLDCFEFVDDVDEAEVRLRTFLEENYGPTLVEDQVSGSAAAAGD